MIFNIFGGLVKSLGVYRHSPLLLAVFLIIQLICIIVSCIFDNMYFKSVISETSFTNKRYNRVKHFVYDTILNLSNSMFVLMVDEKTNIVSPALYTKKSNKISMINRNADILYLSILIFLRVIAQTNTNLSELVNCGIKRQVSRFFL